MPNLKEAKQVSRWKLKFVIEVFNSRDTSVTPELKGRIHNRWFETMIVGYWGMDRGMLQAKMLSELHPYFKRLNDYRVTANVSS